ncbi:glycine cleavage system protein GcvH [Christensenellaceae bacterium OttesenSCG-928-L17]|nr:glycine cleavage system protein GcvH [Christensenellaceae bacterium OttesenSCG-928-L17]
MVKKDRQYTKEHEWVLLEGNVAKLGISHHAQEELGDIVFVELPAVGDTFSAGDSFAVVESVKAVSNVYSPVTGEVVEVNEALDASPELLNEAPYEHFIAAVRVETIDEAALLSAEEYEALLLNS